MYKVLNKPIRSFVFLCPRYRRRRGLLQVPNVFHGSGNFNGYL